MYDDFIPFDVDDNGGRTPGCRSASRRPSILVAVAICLVAVGCGSGAHRPPQADRNAAGQLRFRSCSTAIYQGRDYAQVASGTSGVRVGPTQFGTLKEAGADTTLVSSSPPLYVFKSPLTVGGTSDRWVTVRISTAGRAARLLYDDKSVNFDRHTYDISTGIEAVRVNTGAGCGQGSSGFEQYNGGIVWSHPTCAVITISSPTDRILDRKTIGLGRQDC